MLLALAMVLPITGATYAAASEDPSVLGPVVLTPVASEPGGALETPDPVRLETTPATIDTFDSACVPVVPADLSAPGYCVEMTELGASGPQPAGATDGPGSAAAAAETSDDNGGWPDVCRTTTNENTGGAYLAVDRKNACMHHQGYIVVRDTRTNAITGTAQVETVIKMQSSPSTSRWVYAINVAISFATGNGAPTMSTGRLVACPVDCDVAIAGTYSTNGPGAWVGSGQVDVPVKTSRRSYPAVGTSCLRIRRG